ncbi:MAG: hypothetical protein SV062_03445 [Thermodesulfobacteriota bacterium]|nr:hypothetical protein [Thermodesulfobacteriota bacterium]
MLKFALWLKYKYSKKFIIIAIITLLSFSFKAYPEELKIVGKDASIFKKALKLEKEGKTADAVAAYRLYIKKNKDVVPAYFYLGNLYWDSGYKDKAI